MNKAQRSPFSSLDQAKELSTKDDMIKARTPQSAACLLRPRCLNKKTRKPIGFLVFLDSLKKRQVILRYVIKPTKHARPGVMPYATPSQLHTTRKLCVSVGKNAKKVRNTDHKDNSK